MAPWLETTGEAGRTGNPVVWNHLEGGSDRVPGGLEPPGRRFGPGDGWSRSGEARVSGPPVAGGGWGCEKRGATTMNADQILDAIRHLPDTERRRLLERVAHEFARWVAGGES